MNKIALLLLVALPPCFSTSAQAAESTFGFVYTTDLLPKGEKEIEQWLTLRSKKIAGTFNLIEAKTAYEYGISDDFQGAIYVTYDWMQAFHNGPGGATTPAEQFSYDVPGPDDHYASWRFVGVSFEGVYRILSPYIDPIGAGLYFEPTFGSKFVEIENKLLLQKNFFDDTLVLGFNWTYAPEFRLLPPNDPGDTNEEWEQETDINLSFGASYRFKPNWFAGFEFFNEREFNSLGFSHESNSGYYVGPSIHYGGKKFFVTGVFTAQLPWATTHQDTVAGAVVNGYDLDNDFERYRIRFKIGFYL